VAILRPRSNPTRSASGGRRARAIALLVGAALTAAACSADDGVISISASPSETDRTVFEEPATTTTPAPEATAEEPAPTTTEPIPSTTTAPTVPEIVEPELRVDIALASVMDVGDDKPSRDHDAFAAVALADIERWWDDVYPELYDAPFVPLDGGVYVGYPERDSAIPGCGEPETKYAELQLFVAFYCQDGDFMAYDDGDGSGEFGESILTPLAREYGAAVLGVVLAHEYGHAIQARIGALDRLLATILTEQQADCFAGAWTGQAYRGESPLLRLGDSDVRAGLLAMLSVRDPVGTSQFVPGGHGSAFDRVGAFQEGFVKGPARCATLLDEPLPLMPNQFQTLEDQRRGGNASYDCRDDPNPNCTPAPEFLADDLNNYWATVLTGFEAVEAVAVDDLGTVACADSIRPLPELIVCPGDRTVVFDEPDVRELYNEFGDFTIGYFYGVGWAEMVQHDIETGLSGEPRALLDDCYTGAWVRDITPDERGQTPRGGRDDDQDGVPDGVTSSPGDLDEAIQMAILVGDQGSGVDVVGSPFEKIGAFRTGVLGGLDACDALRP
jgi:predicted metalloprotease